jgi:hypothetical protein
MPTFPAFPNAYEQAADDKFPASQARLVVVSACVDCGAPIYGRSMIFTGDKPPIVLSCRCSDFLATEMDS